MYFQRISNTNPFLTTISSSSSGFTSGGGNDGSNNGSCNNGSSGGGCGGASSSSSSTASRYRQQILVPKELFPPPSSPPTPSQTSSILVPPTVTSTSSAYNAITSNLNTNAYSCSLNHHTNVIDNDDDDDDDDEQKSNSNIGIAITNRKQKSRGYTVRPAKFPLRKHHSFHFQLSQTVAGVKLKKKTNNHNQNSGPLIFKPFFNENSAFKPISPVKCNSPNNPTNIQDINAICINNLCTNNNDEINAPRICGTSLKRHMSNVETYDSSRYTTTSIKSKSSSIIGNIKMKNGNNINRDENYSEDEIGMINSRHDEDGQSITTSSSRTMVPKRLNFDQINTDSSKRYSNNDDTSPMTDEFDDLTVNSDSEQFRRKNRIIRTIPYRPNNDCYDNNGIINNEKSNLESKYVTLTFNEANI